MFATEWMWPVLVSIGLIVVLTGFEVLSIVIADMAERSYQASGREREKRAA